MIREARGLGGVGRGHAKDGRFRPAPAASPLTGIFGLPGSVHVGDATSPARGIPGRTWITSLDSVPDPVALHTFSSRTGRRVRWEDLALGLVTAVLWSWLLEHSNEMGAVQLVAVAVAAVSVGAWRLAPAVTLAVTLSASLFLVATGATTWPPVGPVLVSYLLTASDDRQRGAPRRSAILVGAATAVYLLALMLETHGHLSAAGHAVLAFAVSWFAGERTRLRHEQVADLHDRVHKTLRAAEQETQLAVSEERNRIARDLHDSAGHALSVIAIRAGAAHHRADGSAALDALADIADLARRTAADIDHTVGRLRDADEGERLPIGLASAVTLIQERRETGLDITIVGDPAAANLGAAADQAAYRFLQEALTNAARHGSGATIVEFARDDQCFWLTVSNPVVLTECEPSAGHGLIGMRERATAAGGVATVSRTGREFVVRLELPTDETR